MEGDLREQRTCLYVANAFVAGLVFYVKLYCAVLDDTRYVFSGGVFRFLW